MWKISHIHTQRTNHTIWHTHFQQFNKRSMHSLWLMTQTQSWAMVLILSMSFTAQPGRGEERDSCVWRNSCLYWRCESAACLRDVAARAAARALNVCVGVCMYVLCMHAWCECVCACMYCVCMQDVAARAAARALMCVCVCMYIYIYVYIYVYIYIYIYIYIYCVCMCDALFERLQEFYACMFSWWRLSSGSKRLMYACMYACMYVL